MKMTMQVMNLPKMQAMNPTANYPVTSPLEWQSQVLSLPPNNSSKWRGNRPPVGSKVVARLLALKKPIEKQRSY